MAKKNVYTATAPDGSQHKRTTARTYTHAVLVFSGGTWGAYGWCGRPDLAQKKAAEAAKAWPGCGTQVVIAAAETQ